MADHESSKLAYLGVESLVFVDIVVVVPEGKFKLPCIERAVCWAVPSG
jgi:hypothetical protein